MEAGRDSKLLSDSGALRSTKKAPSKRGLTHFGEQRLEPCLFSHESTGLIHRPSAPRGKSSSSRLCWAQPQLTTRPWVSRRARTILLLPQSHRHSHAALPALPVPARETTRSRPKRRQVRSRALPVTSGPRFAPPPRRGHGSSASPVSHRPRRPRHWYRRFRG